MLHLIRRRHHTSARSIRWRTGTLALLLLLLPSLATAQTTLSVPFTNGFVGVTGSNPQDATNVTTFATLGIARIFFIQNSSTAQYELLSGLPNIQGNDIFGTVRIVGTGGTTLDVPASAVWRQNPSGTAVLIGFIPRLVTPLTWTHAGGSLTITDGAETGGTNIGGYLAGYPGPFADDGSEQNGNAALSNVLGSLNAYLGEVQEFRPPGPVTVNTLRTANATPVVTGTVNHEDDEQLTVIVDGVEYSTSSTPRVVLGNGTWALALTAPLAPGTHDITATLTNGQGLTLSDASSNEVTVIRALGLAGGFMVGSKVYDGTNSARVLEHALTLVGVNAGDDVSIDVVTAAFDDARAGTDKSVWLQAVTLRGADAAKYAVELADAPSAQAAITARELTIAGVMVEGRGYDGTSVAALTGTPMYRGLVEGEQFAVGGTPVATFATPGVGTAKPVTVTGYEAPSTDYVVVQPAGLTADITPRWLALDGSFTAQDKTYDGTRSATVRDRELTLTGVVAPDMVSLDSLDVRFASPAVGTGKAVRIMSATLAGNDAGNYAVIVEGAPAASASIAARPVTIGGTFSVADKLFDGTTSATVTTSQLEVVGAVAGDVLTLDGVTAAFDSAAVGAARVVSLTAALLQGTAAGNYLLGLGDAPTTMAAILAIVPPGAPRNLQGTAGDQRLTVTFEAPATMGCRAVTGYVVEYSADGTTWTRRNVASTISTVELSPVGNNLTYRVRVAAVNDCGTGEWSEVGALTPLGPTREDEGTVRHNQPGTSTTTTSGTAVTTTLSVVQDTTLRIVGSDFSLALRSTDTTGVAIPVDTVVLQLEQGGTTTADGTGFAPGTWATVYSYMENGTPRLLGSVLVRENGTFTTTFRVPNELAPGAYTLQVNGVDDTRALRTATLGVQVVEPVPDLVLTSQPDRLEMAVGDTVVFSLTVTNTGRGPAVDVVIPRAFDEPGFRFIDATAVQGQFDSATLTWTVPQIAAGATARLTLRAVVLLPEAARAALRGGTIR